ncbi:MAG: GH36-type glycosyl hydrolase domain-containing protein [Wenzhouxiangella sp.]
MSAGMGRAALDPNLEQLARLEPFPGRRASRRTLARGRIRRLRRHQLALYRQLETRLAQSSVVTRAEEWLLDNRHVIEDAITVLADQLPNAYLRQLPSVDSDGAGSSWALRVEVLARTLLNAGQLPLDTGWLEHQVDQFQEISELSIGELWALPGVLALCVLERLMDEFLIELEQAPTAASPAGNKTDQAAPSLVAGLIISLRAIEVHDWHGFFERVSRVERALREDPEGAYAGMEFDSRNRYRTVIEGLARCSRLTESDIARAAVDLARQADSAEPRKRHVGYALLGGGLPGLESRIGFKPKLSQYLHRFVNRFPHRVYFGGLGAFIMLVLAALAWLMAGTGVAAVTIVLVLALAILPASGLAMALLNLLLSRWIPPRPLARMDYEAGLPDSARTVVVMPVLLTEAADVIEVFEHLEGNFLGNKDPGLIYAVLADFADAGQVQTAADGPIIDQAQACLDALAAQYAQGRFLFLCRRRLYNPSEQQWMGWERKRGKLDEFNQLLGGSRETSYEVVLGPAEALNGVRFVITLDADTRMPPGTAVRLVGTLDHPLSRAVLDPVKGGLKAGYSIIQPRLEVDPEHGGDTAFSRIFSGDRTVDLYSQAISDVYHDLFGQGIFSGKGIYDWRAIEHCLRDAIPDNTVLSHDLLEGMYSRVGLASDLVLLEQFPSTTVTFMRRLHRWVRGDWQLLPWLRSTIKHPDGSLARNPLGPLERWKIIDNLRRSVLPPTLLVLLLLGWFGVLPGSALAATVLIAAFSAAPLLSELLGLLTRLLRHPRLAPLVAINALPDLWRQLLHWLISLMLLPYQTGVLIDAIARTGVRMAVSGRNLLQWTTAAQAHKRQGQGGRLSRLIGQMWLSPTVAVAAGLGLTYFQPSSLPVAAPFLLAWWVAPLASWLLDRPIRVRSDDLSAQQIDALRSAGRRTWLFFEHFVGPENHWLPPDNYQEAPRVALARRTSPTNIGMGLNSALAAHDFGWIDLRSLLAWLGNSMERMQELERYRGHWLNWYEIEHLKALHPRYVSTVDSGNLAASLIVLSQAMAELSSRPISLQRLMSGLRDTLMVMRETLQALPADAKLEQLLPPALDWLEQRGQELQAPTEPERYGSLLQFRHRHLEKLKLQVLELAERPDIDLSKETLFELRVWLKALEQQSLRMVELVEHLLPWLPDWSALEQAELDTVAALPAWQLLEQVLLARWSATAADELRSKALVAIATLSELELAPALRDFIEHLPSRLDAAVAEAEAIQTTLDKLGARAAAWVSGMNFDFLYDRDRHLFRIGHDLDRGTADSNHYDLLASEARLASLVAIAKGDVPLRHWLHLGRPYRRRRGRAILMSWGATVFEYLMPELYMRHPPGTLLQHANRAAIRLHRDFAARLRLPWGISESGYYQLDEQRHYQYRSFGVPMLGFRRDLGDRLVIAPYASIMALSHASKAVIANLEQLRAARGLGLYGYYEAVDFGRRESLTPHRPRVVNSWMSHHQGMALLAIDNLLNAQIMVQRFHSDPRIGSAAMLLYERKPLMPPRVRVSRQPRVGSSVQVAPRPQMWPARNEAIGLEATRLSNGHFSMLATARGGSSASWNDFMLTRWQADRTSTETGHRLLVRDLDRKQQIVFGDRTDLAGGEEIAGLLGPHRAEIQRSAMGLNCRLRLGVSSQHDVQVQHLRISNDSRKTRKVLVASYAELAMATAGEFERHPAFARLFIETEYLEALDTLLYRKRPRSASERPLYLAHQLIRSPDSKLALGWDSDRASFLGRGRQLANARGLERGVESMARRSGAVLDPALALAVEVELAPYAELELAFLTGASHSRRELLAGMGFYGSLGRVDWLLQQSAMQTTQETHLLGLRADETQAAMSLFSKTLWPEPEHRGIQGPRPDQAIQLLLFSLGLSGDWPIILVRIHDQHEPAQLDRLIRQHTFLAGRQWQSDLVLIDESAGGYGQPSRDYLQTRIDDIRNRSSRSLRGRVVLLSGRELGLPQRQALARAASVVLDAGRQGLTAGEFAAARARLPEHVVAREPNWQPMRLARSTGLVFANGIGAFDPDNRAYVIELDRPQQTPAPWSNVLANPSFGTLVSSNGSMCSWCDNSSESRISPWANDSVSEPSGEVLYLRDEETGEVWTPTPAPMAPSDPCRISHGLGWSRFEQAGKDLVQTLNIHVDAQHPVKLCELALTNQSGWTRRITATFYLEWVLGTNRLDHAHHLALEVDQDHAALLARNPFSPRAGSACAFVASSQAWHGFTTCRREFLGEGGSTRAPAALKRIGLADQVGEGLDPCAAIQVHLDIPPGQTRSVSFVVGQGADRAHAARLIAQFTQPEATATSRARAVAAIDDLLSSVQVETPEPAMDLMINQWLPYQALMGRLWGRTGYYQSSGAFGYRDQLQDMLAMLWLDPASVREHLLLAASRQFVDGDVLHWWHEKPLRGVRTRCSDDLLWLPYAVAHYVKVSGDAAVLDVAVPYLDGAPLNPDEAERYAEFGQSERLESLYEHCKRAIDRATTVGPHGLPTIGSGDWNDGFNQISLHGRGESVWLAWFLIRVLNDFSACCETQAEPGCAGLYRQLAVELQRQVDAVAWDGHWYQRAYFDDGSALGSAANEECQIDLIAQAWSVLGPEQPTPRSAEAMASALERLVDEPHRLVKLLTPPFDTGPQNPGYIKGYPPGVRENGAQYTHAATWSIWAMARLGQGDCAMALFRLLNPILRTLNREDAEAYRLEPYVLAGDIYSVGNLSGRGGWSWYTGAAAWLYRAGIEALLGLTREGDEMLVRPCLPADWPGYQAILKRGEARYHIEVVQSSDQMIGSYTLLLDGELQAGDRFAFSDDGRSHRVHLTLPLNKSA